jgi:hypothetical protein
MDDIETILSELGYSPKWLDYKLIDLAFLEAQYLTYQKGVDKNTEHYRFRAFQIVLNDSDMLDDKIIDQYIELATLDPDHSMGQSALALLAKSPKLTDEQLKKFGERLPYREPFLQRTLARIGLLRELETHDITEQLFEKCISSGDAEIQRIVFARIGSNTHYLEILKNSGANKAIRNLAKRELQRLKIK